MKPQWPIHQSSPRPVLASKFVAAIGLALACLTPAFGADEYPSRTITLVVPWPAGGATDANARLIASEMAKDLGQSIVVENKSGAGGSIGGGVVARAEPDGYTMVYISSSNVITSLLVKSPTYGIGGDLTPVAMTASEPLLLLVSANGDIKSIDALVKLAKSDPAGLTYGSTGPGGLLHVAAANLLSSLGVKGTQVPYRGTAPALTDLMGNQIQMFFGTFSDAFPLVAGKKLRALAVTTPTRSPILPDVPTLSEATGKPESERGTWQGILVPKGTPPDIIARLEKSINVAVGVAATRERLLAKGVEPHGGTPAEFDARIKSELERRGSVIKELGITSF